jgi:hypothetical protein
MPDSVEFEVTVSVQTPEIDNDQLAMVNDLFMGGPMPDVAFDVLQQALLEALTGAGVPEGDIGETECLRTRIKRRVTLDEDELSPVDWLSTGDADDVGDTPHA